MTNPKAEDVTAVVCTWNAEENIVDCLQALKNTGVNEIFLVDATSSDRTRELAEPYVTKIMTDPRKGLGAARNIGLRAATRRFVMHVGPDNIMPSGSVDGMLNYMQKGGYSGVSAVTVLSGSGYWSWATDHYKRSRFFPGERAFIGTPSLFPTDLSLEMPFDDNMGFSDDADLCERWGAKGHRFAISDVEVQEAGVTTFEAIMVRYRMYGKSDLEIWNKYSPSWSLGRKIVSLLHPLRHELVQPFFKIQGLKRVGVLPFLILITATRYVFWCKFWLTKASR